MDQLDKARERLEQASIAGEDKEILEQGVAEYLHELKEQHRCAFCKHQGLVKVDDSAIILCTHCFKIIEENISSMKAFLGCR